MFGEKSGEYRKVLGDKKIWRYDDKGNQIEKASYKIEEKSGKVQEIPTQQTVWEYEFY